MQIRIFTIPLTDSGDSLSELNRFLSGHKVLEVEQRFCQYEHGSCWTFCVRFISGLPTVQGGSKGKIDYKQTLSEREFAVFSRLREIRKALAAEDGVPAYAVCTDEEMAAITRLPEITEKGLATIPGIGEKRIARYGKQLIELYYADGGVLSASGLQKGGLP